MGNYVRCSAARREMHGIVRSLGLYLNTELGQALSHARKPKAERHAIEEKERKRLAHIEHL